MKWIRDIVFVRVMHRMLIAKLLAALAFVLMPSVAVSENNDSSNSSPCASSSHRAFDFWLGQWRVSAQEKIAGYNQITSIQNGCVVKEEWRSATSAYTGTSYNYYHSDSNQWRQVWLDNQGGHLELSGARVGNSMVLKSTPLTNDQGREIVNRITWTLLDDGAVRQLWAFISNQSVDMCIEMSSVTVESWSVFEFIQCIHKS